MPAPNVDEIVEAVKEETKSHYDKMDKKYDELSSVLAALESKSIDNDTLEGHLKDIREDLKSMSAKADELDTKLGRPGGGKEEFKSAGEQVIGSDEYKALSQKGRGSMGAIEVKAVTNVGNEVSGLTQNALVPAHRQPGIVAAPDQPLMVRDIIPTGTTTSDMIQYVEETGFTNGAAPVAETTAKPESDLDFDLKDAPVRTIAHWIHASNQVLSDAGMLKSYIDNRLLFGLKQKEEVQIMLGDGTGQNLNGLIPNATSFVSTGIPPAAQSNIADVARWAKLQVRKSFYPADAIVLNPVDYAKLEMLKDGDGKYLYSVFTSGVTPRLWGMRIVESDTLPEGQFMCGSFSLAANIWDRQQATIDVSTEDRDNFIKNMTTIRCEERLALTVERPDAFVHGSLTVS